MATISGELLRASQQASQKYNIPVSVILGFAGLETQFGTTGMGKSKNNAFGIGSKSYDSISDSVEDFAKLVTGNKDSSQSKKYGEATANAKTNEEWVNAIRDSGYNSEYADGVYEEKVLSVIKSYDLDNYNGTGVVTEETIASRKTGGLKWWGDIVVVVFALLLLVGGVVFIGLGITSTATGGKAVKAIKKVVN